MIAVIIKVIMSTINIIELLYMLQIPAINVYHDSFYQFVVLFIVCDDRKNNLIIHSIITEPFEF